MGGALEPLLEALDLAGGVDDGLLAGEERVAVRADVDVQRLLRGADLELGMARAADDLGGVVLGMDVWLHALSPVAAPTAAGAMGTTRTRFLSCRSCSHP